MNGAEIRDYRRRHQLSQRELAAMLGLHENSIYQYEHGTIAARPIVQKLLHALEGGPTLTSPNDQRRLAAKRRRQHARASKAQKARYRARLTDMP